IHCQVVKHGLGGDGYVNNEYPLNNLYKTLFIQLYSSSVNILSHDIEGFLSYPLMSLYRQVLQPLLHHDPKTLPRVSLSIRSAYVSLSLYIRLIFIPLSLSPRYSLALQLYTTPAHHLDSTWSSPLTTTSASTTTSATTSCRTSYIFIDLAQKVFNYMPDRSLVSLDLF
ncbi:hypothetical protein IGI04_002246, partial [Brassica rapa subsp. trilocularis]